jgi:hypothetical protein
VAQDQLAVKADSLMQELLVVMPQLVLLLLTEELLLQLTLIELLEQVGELLAGDAGLG